ncbi:MAG: hypothetical protein ACREE6_02860 [Limisphaerales bacterium]
MRQVIARWAEKKYVRLSDRDSVRAQIDALKIDGPPLTKEMREAYSDAIVDFLFAFKDGSTDSWKKFRFEGAPENLNSAGVFQVEFYFGITNKTGWLPEYLPHDPDFIERWIARSKHGKPPEVRDSGDLEGLFYRYVTEITYGKFYRNYFEGICIDEMIIKHDRYSFHPKPLYQYPFFPFTVRGPGQVNSTFPNIGYKVWNNEDPARPFFTVHPTLTELLASEGTIDCINTFVYIKINETGEVAPFLLRHVWNPKTRHWQIAEAVDCHNSSYNRLIHVIVL